MTEIVCLLIGLGLGYFAGTHPAVVSEVVAGTKAKLASVAAWIETKPWKGK